MENIEKRAEGETQGADLASAEAALDAANFKLRQWEEVWGPVMDFGYKNAQALGIQLGGSISASILTMLKAKASPKDPQGRQADPAEDHQTNFDRWCCQNATAYYPNGIIPQEAQDYAFGAYMAAIRWTRLKQAMGIQGAG